MSKQYHFRCTANPGAPILTLHSYWEAKEMKGHPDYEQIDEFGEAVIDEEALAQAAEQTIPLRK